MHVAKEQTLSFIYGVKQNGQNLIIPAGFYYRNCLIWLSISFGQIEDLC